MKKMLVLISIVFEMSLSNIIAQNLVPNPSFEDTLQCPDFPQPTINYALYWSSYGETSDYFNPCANNQPFWGIPNNIAGFQDAYNGNSFAGLITWTIDAGSPIREYMGVQLTQPLTIGEKYFVSCFISNGDTPVYNSSSNKFGFKFSTVRYTEINQAPIDNFSHIHSDSIITDKINWTRVAGSFIADSAYEYLIIGNFYDNTHTNADTSSQSSFTSAYYYLDAVCVSSDSIFDATWTEQKELGKRDLVIVFPNPADNFFSISNNDYLDELLVIDYLGNILNEKKLNDGLNQINISSLAAGIYVLVFDRKYYFKLIVQH